MSSIGSILSIARSALLAQQAGVQIASHNIANATTEGYSRQRLELTPTRHTVQPGAMLGGGPALKDVIRLRDSFADASLRNSSGEAESFRRRSELLTQVESLYMEPSEVGLGASMDAFFASWSDLADNPLSSTGRAVLRENALRLTGHFQRMTAGLQQIRTSTEQQLQQEVGEVGQLTANIGALNARILAAEASGNTSGELRDARDRAIDRIGQLIPVSVIERTDGTVGVSSNGALLVDAADGVQLTASSAGGVWSVQTSRGVTLSLPAGSIGAALGVLRTDLPAARAELDTLARSLVMSVNAVHVLGTNPLGDDGVSFFQPPPDMVDGDGNVVPDVDSINADNIALSDAVLADALAIAAGTGGADADGNPVYRGGATDIATAIVALRDDTGTTGGRSFGGYYANSVARIGQMLQGAEDSLLIEDTLVSQAQVRRASVSGVSIDEEMIELIRYQNAYSAAARVVTAADEMLQSVLGMLR